MATQYDHIYPGSFNNFELASRVNPEILPKSCTPLDAYGTALSEWRARQSEDKIRTVDLSQSEKYIRAQLGLTVLRVNQHLDIFQKAI